MWGIFILETALTAITTRVTYSLLADGWGVPNALVRLSKVDAFIPVIGGLGEPMALLTLLADIEHLFSVRMGPDVLCLEDL